MIIVTFNLFKLRVVVVVLLSAKKKGSGGFIFLLKDRLCYPKRRASKGAPEKF